jgi:hypothetical protein
MSPFKKPRMPEPTRTSWNASPANLDNKNPATWWDWGRRGYLKEEVYNPWQPVPHEPPGASRAQGRAGNGTRTRDIHLGKVTLYQLSYSRVTKNITNSQPFCKSFLNLLPFETHRHARFPHDMPQDPIISYVGEGGRNMTQGLAIQYAD